VTVKHLFTGDKSFGATEKIVSVTKKTLGAADKVLSAVLMIFSVANTIVLVTNKVLSDRLTVLIAMELSVVPKFRPFDVQSEPFIE